MKTNLLISRLRNIYLFMRKHRILFTIAAISLLLLLISLFTSCKTPATLTNDTQHHTRDSNYHATVHRIETHDTIIIRTLPPPPLKGGRKRPSKSPLKGAFVGPSKSP